MSFPSGALTGIAGNKVAFISRDDVAAAAGILLGKNHAGAIYNATATRPIPGPSGWRSSEMMGAPLGFAAVPAETLVGGMTRMGLPDHIINAVVGIQQDFADGAFDIVTGDVLKLSGRVPKNLRDVLGDLLRGSP